MADTASPDIGAEDGQALLDGFDGAWQHVLHGRYGGGVTLCRLSAQGEQPLLVLRGSRHAGSDCIRLVLQSGAHPPAALNGDGIVLGTMRLAAGTQMAEIDVVTEMFDEYDVNETADATSLQTGVLLTGAPAGQQLGGLRVIRSTEAETAGDSANLRQARGWLPQRSRMNPSRALGLSGYGHRRAPQARVTKPVAAALLGSVGAAVAAWSTARPAMSISAAALVVETSSTAGV